MYVRSGTTTGMSGLTDSPSDEKLETLLAIPFLSCFLWKSCNKSVSRKSFVTNIRVTAFEDSFLIS